MRFIQIHLVEGMNFHVWTALVALQVINYAMERAIVGKMCYTSREKPSHSLVFGVLVP